MFVILFKNQLVLTKKNNNKENPHLSFWKIHEHSELFFHEKIWWAAQLGILKFLTQNGRLNLKRDQSNSCNSRSHTAHSLSNHNSSSIKRWKPSRNPKHWPLEQVNSFDNEPLHLQLLPDIYFLSSLPPWWASRASSIQVVLWGFFPI